MELGQIAIIASWLGSIVSSGFVVGYIIKHQGCIKRIESKLDTYIKYHDEFGH